VYTESGVSNKDTSDVRSLNEELSSGKERGVKEEEVILVGGGTYPKGKKKSREMYVYGHSTTGSALVIKPQGNKWINWGYQ